jgi:hypothetical protein
VTELLPHRHIPVLAEPTQAEVAVGERTVSTASIVSLVCAQINRWHKMNLKDEVINSAVEEEVEAAATDALDEDDDDEAAAGASEGDTAAGAVKQSSASAGTAKSSSAPASMPQSSSPGNSKSTAKSSSSSSSSTSATQPGSSTASQMYKMVGKMNPFGSSTKASSGKTGDNKSSSQDGEEEADAATAGEVKDVNTIFGTSFW